MRGDHVGVEAHVRVHVALQRVDGLQQQLTVGALRVREHLHRPDHHHQAAGDRNPYIGDAVPAQLDNGEERLG